MDLDVRELLTDTIKRYLDRYCEENGFDPVWGDPIVGFADARSPLFRELKIRSWVSRTRGRLCSGS